MALCIVVVFGAGLRAYALDFQSLWTDEISSLMITDPTLPFRQFWDRVLADTHPPIYYLILRWSSSALGQSEIVARAPSVLFGILTVCAAGILPSASLSRSSRVALALLLAVSPGGTLLCAPSAAVDAHHRGLHSIITLHAARRPRRARGTHYAHNGGVARFLHALLRLPPYDGSVFHLLSSG
jgi:hypothetical protein